MPTPSSTRVVISNATPIISLSILGKLDLLEKLYGDVLIPTAVEAELVAGGTRAGAAAVQAAAFLSTVSLQDSRHADLLNDLDRGEAETIALALERKADLVIIDERLGRRHAQRLGLSVTGVLGILLRAKEQGHLSEVQPEIARLRAAGIRLGNALVERVLQLAGEA